MNPLKRLLLPVLVVAAGLIVVLVGVLSTPGSGRPIEHPMSPSATDGDHRAHGGAGGSAHASAMALVDLADVTHRAVADGDWSSSSTWSGGAVPVTGSRVHIPASVAVTVDRKLTPEIETIRVDGTLRFATDVDTELLVDTLVTTPDGTLEIGTPGQPIDADVIASVVFADDGPIDRRRDPGLLGRGAILMGRTVIEGAEVLHRATMARFPIAGDTELVLNADPDGWRIGDTVVITGTNGPESDEVRTVAAINGRTIGLDSPLDADHVPPAADLDLYVANLTRNVRFASENSQINRRGHLMVMHSLDANIRGARFTDMGRTDKSNELNDVDFGEIEPGGVGWDGTFELLGGDNIRGRYTVHFHRGGADPTSTPGVVADSVVVGDPGWAFTNHSSHVDFLRNVAYDNAGAGFFTEAGDEVGQWIDNIAIRTVMPNFVLDDAGAIDPDLRASRQDFGVDGDGYWLQGNRIDMIGNVAAGSSAHGIIWWSEALAEADLGRVSTVRVDTLPDPSLVPGRDEIPVWWAPLGEVRDNVSYGAIVGFRARYIHGATYLADPDVPPDAYIDSLNPLIDGITTWDVRDGVLMNYNERVSLRNIRAIGIGEPFRHNFGHTAAVGVGLDVGNDSTHGPATIENVELSGFEVGIIGPRHGRWTIENVRSAAVTDVLLHSPETSERSLALNNLDFQPLDPLTPGGENRRNVVLAYEYNGDGDGVDPSTAGEVEADETALLADRVTWDGVGLYSNGQLPDAVPMGVGDYEGLTNQQLFDRFGLAAGGAMAPDSAETDHRVVNGVVGPPAPEPTITHRPGAPGEDEDAGEFAEGDADEADEFDEDEFEFDGDDVEPGFEDVEDRMILALEERFGEDFDGLDDYLDDEGFIDLELLVASCADRRDRREVPAGACAIIDGVELDPIDR